MIDIIWLDTGHAVIAMQSSGHLVQTTLEVAQRSGEALEEITRSISQINERNLLIASATEEQALVAREVDRNLMGIRNLSSRSCWVPGIPTPPVWSWRRWQVRCTRLWRVSTSRQG